MYSAHGQGTSFVDLHGALTSAFADTISPNLLYHQGMSDARLRSSSTSSQQRPVVLPPSLHLNAPSQDLNIPERPEGSRLTVKNFTRAFHELIFSRRPGREGALDKVAEAADEDEDENSPSKPVHSMKRRRLVRHTSRRLSTSSVTSRPSSSHHPVAVRSTRTLVTSHPSLRVSDVPPRSPTNKSPFSAVLLSRDSEEDLEDDPSLSSWHTEQLHRARLAKLTRHLGEEIPAEMVLGPAFLSQGDSVPCARPQRGGRHHHKRRSLDPAAFLQSESALNFGEGSGNLRRSRSLWAQDDRHSEIADVGSPATAIAVNAANSEHKNGRLQFETENADALMAVPVSCPPAPGAPQEVAPTAAALSSEPPKLIVDIPKSGALLYERVSVDTSSENPVSPSSRPSYDAVSETSHSSPRVSRAPLKSRTLPRRPATADASRRVEKLANFFGVDHQDLTAAAQLRGTARTLQYASSNAAGDLAIGIHSPHTSLDVDVQVHKPSRFWGFMDGRATAKNVHPDDVMQKLRTMKAS
ncbi:hypothetical protein HYDPIDRAFT_106446 [Hydnomerulius pinastri MD-312]|nr:hypothetical protein HYDPIDRAFT_106446 [Hydnomerulius pinastri MD-312]